MVLCIPNIGNFHSLKVESKFRALSGYSAEQILLWSKGQGHVEAQKCIMTVSDIVSDQIPETIGF